MTEIFSVFLLILLITTAAAAIRTPNLFAAVMLMGIFSLLIAINFFLLDAADVALTEAAVGAGISTVLFLSALAFMDENERARAPGRLAALLAVSVTGLLMAYASLYEPAFGDPSAPANSHLSPWFLEKTESAVNIPNVITAILGSFRGYDTLGEVFVVFTAGIGVLFLLGSPTSDRLLKTDEGLRHYLIPRMVGRLLIPFILLYGLYVQFHGEYGPGGGFQAGALVAAAMILFTLLEGQDQSLRVLPQKVLTGFMIAGALLYAGVGVVGIIKGGTFLDYNVLSVDPVSGQQIGIILIEAGVGLTVTGVLLSVFHAFIARGRIS